MIEFLDDLVVLSQRLAKRSAALADSVFTRPGISAAEYGRIRRALPGIPRAYLDIIYEFDVSHMGYCYFSLTPGRVILGSVAAQIIERNNPRYYLASKCLELGTYFVAGWDIDLLAIATATSRWPEGTMVRYDGYDDPNYPPRVIAASYEHLLLLIGNLEEMRVRFAAGELSEDPREVYRGYLARQPNCAEIAPAWEDIVDVVLGTD